MSTLFKKKYKDIHIDLNDTKNPLYIKVLEILRLQDISYSDDKSDDIDNYTSIKKEQLDNLNENIDDDTKDEKEIENWLEEMYIKSLRSSIYSEIFQEQFSKHLSSLVEKLKNKKPTTNEFKKLSKFILECSNKEEFSSLDKNNFIVINDIINVINERDNKLFEFESLFNEISANVDKFKNINKEKQEYINYVIESQKWNEMATNKIIQYMNIDIESLARKFVQFNKNWEWYYSILDDLKQEGYIWILNGIKKFKPQKSDNVKYYLRLWIKQSMISYLSSKNDIIKVPAHIKNLNIKIQKVVGEFTKNNIPFTIEDIAKKLEIPADKIAHIINVEKMANVNTFSSIITDDWEEMWLDNYNFMEDKSINIEQDMFEREEIKELFDTVKNSLNEEEQFILIHRWALFWVERLTLRDLWDKFWKTEERIRQIEERAKSIVAIRYFDKKYWVNFREKMKEQNLTL